jgi:hypothetical protein
MNAIQLMLAPILALTMEHAMILLMHFIASNEKRTKFSNLLSYSVKTNNFSILDVMDLMEEQIVKLVSIQFKIHLRKLLYLMLNIRKISSLNKKIKS